MTDLITRFKQDCSELNPDLDLVLNECDDNAFLDPITEAHWQGYQMANRWLPIEDAPIHENIIAFCEKYQESFVAFKSERGIFVGERGDDLGRICRLTHYMKSPIPPLTTKGGE